MNARKFYRVQIEMTVAFRDGYLDEEIDAMIDNGARRAFPNNAKQIHTVKASEVAGFEITASNTTEAAR